MILKQSGQGKMVWKEVTTTYICSAHFESKCFSARKRINFETAVIVSPAEDAAHTNVLGEHDYAAAPPGTEVTDVDQAAATTAQSQVAADHDYAAGNLDTEVAAAQTVQSMIVDDHDYAATQPDTKVAVIAPPAELASTLEECQESNKKLLEQIESLKSANAKLNNQCKYLKRKNDLLKIHLVNLKKK